MFGYLLSSANLFSLARVATLILVLLLQVSPAQTLAAPTTEEATQAIERLGGLVLRDRPDGRPISLVLLGSKQSLLKAIELLPSLTTLESISFGSSEPILVHFSCFESLIRLQNLSLTGVEVDRRGLGTLKRLKLTSFVVHRAGLTDKDMHAISANPHLRELDIGGNKIGDRGLAVLVIQKQLESLSIYDTLVTDKGLKHLQELSQLQEIDISNLAVTDEGINYLRELTRLKKINMSRLSVTDKSVASLLSLHELEDIDLSSTHISDKGLGSLARLKHIRELNVANSRVSARGLRSIVEIESLMSLSICGKQMSVESAKYINRAPALTRLALIGDLVDDTVFPKLTNLTKVETIAISESTISLDGLLKANFPKQISRITIDGPTISRTSLKAIQEKFPGIMFRIAQTRVKRAN